MRLFSKLLRLPYLCIQTKKNVDCNLRVGLALQGLLGGLYKVGKLVVGGHQQGYHAPCTMYRIKIKCTMYM